MSIIFECPNCRQPYETGEHLAGKGMRCRACQAVMRVPVPGAPKTPPAPPAPRAAVPPPLPGRAVPPPLPGRAVPPPLPPAAMASRPAPPHPAPAFEPPDDDEDDDTPYAVAEVDEEDDEPPPRPAAAPRPPAVPPPLPTTGGRPSPLPRMSFDLPPSAAGAPPNPPRPTPSRTREEPPAREKAESGKMAKFGGAGAAGLLALVVGLRVLAIAARSIGGGAEEETIIVDAAPDFGAPAASSAPSFSPRPGGGSPPAAPPPAGPWALPVFPEIGPGFEVEPGVTWQEIRLRPAGGLVGDPPPGSLMTLWLYLPAGHHDPASLPCVLIAPAGSTLVTGNSWGRPTGAPTDPPSGDEGRHPEHLPYARAGFAVLGYELDGWTPDEPTMNQIQAGARKFLAARAGLDNAHLAIEFLKARVPQVDPNRLYAAGHSSAATTALLVAANEPGIAGCVAFAPCVDVMGRFQRSTGDAEGLIRDLERSLPGVRALFTTYSPLGNLSRINCPVFVMHAEDDDNVPIADSRLVVERCKPGQVTMVTVPRGGHYSPMIRGGIDQAIKWLVERGARPAPPGARPPDQPAAGVIPGF